MVLNWLFAEQQTTTILLETLCCYNKPPIYKTKAWVGDGMKLS